MTAKRVVIPDLRNAVQAGEIRLEFQPEFDLRDRSVLAVEALARWDHPTLGTLGADAFIRLAEQTGQIVEFGTWILRAACTQFAAWAGRASGPPLTVRVNVSPIQLCEPSFPKVVDDVLDGSGLRPGQVCLEITERVEPPDVVAMGRALQALHERGLHLALDDFGVGRNGLARLRDSHYDTIKIDRQFVTDLAEGSRDMVIVSAITALAWDLGLEVVAEGIEHQAAIDALLGVGCMRGQGFLLAEPADAEVVSAVLGIPTT